MLRMKLLLLTFLGVLAAIVSAEEPIRRGGNLVEYQIQVARVPLTTNTSEEINGEVRDPSFLFRLLSLKNAEPIAQFGVLLNGNSQFLTLWLRFEDGSTLDKDETGQKILQFAELRRRGLSRETASRFVNHPKPIANENDARELALKRVLPWLPFSELRRVQKGDVASMWWVGAGDEYVFRDSDVAYLVRFVDIEAGKMCVTDVLDAREWTEPFKRAFPRAEAAARKELKLKPGTQPKSAPVYWVLLQKHLKEAGVDWLSPADLNPLTAWR